MGEPASNDQDSLAYYLGALSNGGQRAARSGWRELHDAARAGLRVETAERVRERSGMRAETFYKVIPRTTLQSRKRAGGRLTPEQSEKIMRIAWAYARAADVFGDRDRGERWMAHANSSLEGQAPAELLDTEPGARYVEELLGQLEHGIAA